MTQHLSGKQTPSIRILVCGLVAADIIFHVDKMPQQAKKYRSKNMRFSLGGGGAIAAVALRRMGVLVHLAGRLGDDSFATLVRDQLRLRDIEISRVAQVPNVQTSISSIFIDANGERQIMNFRDTNDEESSDLDPLCLDSLTASSALDAVLVDTRWEEAALEVLHFARSQHIPAVIDGEAPVSHAAMALATHVAFSRQGLSDYAGTDDIEPALRRASTQFDNWVCVTDGDLGVFYLDDDEVVQVPSLPVVAVDTLGAGDVWHATFTLQLARGANEHDAIVFANAAAALKCASASGIDAAPDYAAVMALLAQQRM